MDKTIQLTDNFDWELYPEMEALSKRLVLNFLKHNNFARDLSCEVVEKTSTRFIDWVDHIIVPEKLISYRQIDNAGMKEMKYSNKLEDIRVFKHMRSYLFPILIGKSSTFELALKTENIDDFAQYISSGVQIDGTAFSEFRKAVIKKESNYALTAVERRGYDGFVVSDFDDTDQYIKLLSSMFARDRHFESDKEGFKDIEKKIKKARNKMSDARISDCFFRSERMYWQKRNMAGHVQKARQDCVGLGWGNQDHHTFRSSRENFTKMIKVFELMGYKCRERYYAGEKAGWGAQILEHPICDIVVFTDVDLHPDETQIDFAHKGFENAADTLGTVGLWTGLHGESILEAGMHHLEARFDFDRLNLDLPRFGIKLMPPFSYFKFLKQAFTVGEHWKVQKTRLDDLLNNKYVTKAQYKTFLKSGAIGSHMENLERNQGFKGFNKSSVTKIIIATDPRKQHFTGA